MKTIFDAAGDGSRNFHSGSYSPSGVWEMEVPHWGPGVGIWDTLNDEDEDDEIAYFTVRWKTRASFVYRTKNMR